MTLADELQYQNEQLVLVRQQITKLRSSHVESYSYSGNSAAYRSLDELVKDENRLLTNIRKLEAAVAAGTSGKTINSVFVGAMRIR